MNIELKNFSETSKYIYQYFADEQSRYIFRERILYAFTGEKNHIENIVKMNKEGIEFCEILDGQDDIYIFGAGTWGKEIVQVWPDRWKGFLDNDRQKWGQDICGVKVYSPKDVINKDYNGKVLISSRLYYQEIMGQLLEMGMKESHIINVGLISDSLAEKQYFSLNDLQYGDDEVFADVGSLDGATSLQFIRRVEKFSKIYCFEPDRKNIEKCKSNLEGYIQNGLAEIINKGVWSSEGKLNFLMQGNGTSAISEDGFEIEVTTLDEVFSSQKVTFIKMDIEGAEWEALLGASDVIKKYKPKMAIAVYHKPEDIIELPKLLLQLNPDYKFYLRHYSLAAAETVLYAI